MKIFGLLALAALASSSFASYELMLVVDQSKDSISRFDAVTGASLGTFGSNYLIDPQSVALIHGSSDCLVFDNGNGRAHRFNYSTGEYVSSINLPVVPAISTMIEPFSDGTFLVWGFSTSTAYRMTVTGGLLNTYAVPAGGGIISAAGLNSSGEVYIAWTGTDKIHRYGIGGAVQGVSAATGALGWGAQMNVKSSYGFFTQSTATLFKFAPGNPATAIETMNLPAGSSAFGVAFGHGDAVYACGIDGTGSAIWAIDGVSKTITQKFTPAGVTTPVHMAIVVAPEPGAIFVVGTGLVLIARRRQRRS